MYIKLHEKVILTLGITLVILLSCLVFFSTYNSKADSYTPKSKNHANVHHVPAVVKQVIKNFDNPEGAIFSADGKFVFISNSAEIGDRGAGFSWTENEGYISKLSVNEDGTLTMVEEKLITNISSPLGMGVLPVSTEKFPAGTIFACVGAVPMVDQDGQTITDRNRMRSKLLAFDTDGNILGEIDTGAGSIFEDITGSPIALINALGFDGQGNLFVADTAFGQAQFDPPWDGAGGLWKISVDSLDQLAEGKNPSTMPQFLAIPGNPDGVEVSPVDGKVYVNTVGPVAGAPDPANGGIYAISNMKTLPAPIDGGLGALDGLDFTANGTMINSQIRGDIPARLYVNCVGQEATTLELVPYTELSGPADVAIKQMSDGSYMVVVPELMARDNTPGDDEVTVLALPSNFDCR
tara:strand:- start:25452 stop:26675 length:1224 start_codon:yes stop_codon:yes gene_type:complete